MVTVGDAEAFLHRRRSEYFKLLADVRDVCEAVEAGQGHGVVRAVYGRDAKQANEGLADAHFKDPAKIAKAAARDGIPFEEIEDIIGLTVVVYYADQIVGVADAISDNLKFKRINSAKIKEKKVGGYYATHLVLRSDHTNHRHLLCEVQLKTMLHDAWASKTHDLIYKPQGRHDPRLDRMMNMFAESLQAIEVQSETLRDIIEERASSEAIWRRLLHSQLFDHLPGWAEAVHSDKGQTLRADLIDRKASLPDLGENDDEVQELAGRIDELCRESLREGYLLESFLALLRDRKADRRRAEERAIQWSKVAMTEFRANRAKAHDVWSVPLLLYVSGNLPLAIEVGEQLLADGADLPERERQILAFNLADHLIEDAYFSLPLDASDQTERRARIEDLIESAKTLREDDATPFEDAEGMIEVAFSQDPAQLRAAIEKIHAGNQNVPEPEREAAQAYFELHIRLAWRRLLEVEAKLSQGRIRRR